MGEPWTMDSSLVHAVFGSLLMTTLSADSTQYIKLNNIILFINKVIYITKRYFIFEGTLSIILTLQQTINCSVNFIVSQT
jgi:hypothetical protein